MRKSIVLLLALLLTSYFEIYAQNRNASRIKISVNGKELIAVLEDNATSRALIEMLPMSLSMRDLFNREMCHYFDRDLPTDNVRNMGYEVGDIMYWPPKRSFVIMYRQTGGKYSMQRIGRIETGVEIFESTGDAEVRFEIIR